jgi:hypothetical protein
MGVLWQNEWTSVAICLFPLESAFPFFSLQCGQGQHCTDFESEYINAHKINMERKVSQE